MLHDLGLTRGEIERVVVTAMAEQRAIGRTFCHQCQAGWKRRSVREAIPRTTTVLTGVHRAALSRPASPVCPNLR